MCEELGGSARRAEIGRSPVTFPSLQDLLAKLIGAIVASPIVLRPAEAPAFDWFDGDNPDTDARVLAWLAAEGAMIRAQEASRLH